MLAVEQALGIAVTGVLQRHTARDDVGADVVDIDLVAHQRVHAVDRDELLGEGVRHAVVVRVGRADDTGQGMVDGRAAGLAAVDAEDAQDEGVGAGQVLLQHARLFLILVAVRAGAQQAPPVGVHGTLGDRVGDHRRGPFHGVDLGHQRGVDQACVVVQPLVVLVRILLLEHRRDGVVFLGEQLVQHAQADPPVLVEAGDRLATDEIGRQGAVRIDLQLAIDEGADLVVGGLVAAVQLRTVPPVSVVVAVSGRLAGFGCGAARVGLGAAHGEVARAEHVAGRQRYLDRIGFGVGAVVDPVMHHELDPGSGNEIEAGRRLELAARHQHVTHFPRVGAEQGIGFGFAVGHGGVHVAPETAVNGALGRVGKDVAGAVLGTRNLAARVTGDGGVGGRQVVDVEQVFLEQHVALERECDQAGVDAQSAELDQARPRDPNRHGVISRFFLY